MSIPRAAVRHFIGIAALLCLVLPITASAQCNLIQMAVQSFIPRQIDSQAIRSFADITPSAFASFRSNQEHQALASVQTISDPAIENRMVAALNQFYAKGAIRYGVNVPPQVQIGNTLEVNAFASGTMITVDEGLLLYFLNPSEYWRQIGASQLARYTPWTNDWNSIYAVLAHEAGHNLMRHVDEGELDSAGHLLEDYGTHLKQERKNLADGKPSSGFGGYLSQSLANFANALSAPAEQRKRETEADEISIRLLKDAGADPEWSYQAAQKLDLYTQLIGATPTTRLGTVKQALCSDHPAWQNRMLDEQTNLRCLRFTGNLCSRHVTFPEATVFDQIHTFISQADSYEKQTQQIESTLPTPGAQAFSATIKVKPKEATLLIDNQPSRPGKMNLALGRHQLTVSSVGYISQTLQVVVFPDAQPNLTVKLKRTH